MSDIRSWAVKCQDTPDESGDVIVELPPEVLARLGLDLGDELSLEVTDGAIVLKPVRSKPSSP
ncbi:AbrB/MazE/SpoVT family DNA-binding domain-containing protein [Pseudomonas sp. ZS1P83]